MRQLCNVNFTYVHLRIGVCIMTVAISQRGPMRSSHADRPPHQITSATSIIEVPLRNSITISCRALTQHFSDSHKYTTYFKDKKS